MLLYHDTSVAPKLKCPAAALTHKHSTGLSLLPLFLFFFASLLFPRHSRVTSLLRLSPSDPRHCLVSSLPLQRNTCRLEFTNWIPLPLTYIQKHCTYCFRRSSALNPGLSSSLTHHVIICWACLSAGTFSLDSSYFKEGKKDRSFFL